MGKRLREHTTNTPKALVKVHGKPLVHYAIDHLRAMGFSRIIVVGGFCYEDLKNTVNAIDASVEVVENPDYTMQNLLSLDVALPLIKEDESIFVVNVDYIMRPHTLKAMQEKQEGFSVYASFDPSANAEDVMTVKVRDGNKVVAMSKTLTDFEAVYTGFWFVDSTRMPGMREVVEKLKKELDPVTTTVEHIFREEIAQGRELIAQDVGPADWFEIDTPEELAIAEQGVF